MAINKIAQTVDALPNAESGEWAWIKIVSNELKFNSDGSNTRTIVTTAQTQTLTNKTLTAPTITAPTITGATSLGTGATITAPVLSGSVTGTYTLAGTPTITSPTINGATIGGTSTMSAGNLNGDTKFCTTQFDAVTGTTGTTLTNVVGLTGFSLAAAGTYQYEIVLNGVSTANSGFKVGLGYTTLTATSLEAIGMGFTAAAVAVQHTTTSTTGMSLFAQTAAVIAVRVQGRLVVNAAGTVAVQAAQNAAHADTTSVYVGSYATFNRVS